MQTRSLPMIVLSTALFALSLSTAARAEAPSAEANKAVVRKFEEEFKNKANHAIVDELMASTFQGRGLGPAPLDRDGLKQLGKMIAGAFPDVHATIESIVADGDLVVTRVSVVGTNRGSFNGIPATGRKIQFTEMHMYQVKGGKIVALWSNIDQLAIMTQLGAIPAPRR
jgi:predicted ester cyclase